MKISSILITCIAVLLLISCYQKVKHFKDLGKVKDEIQFETNKPVGRIILNSKAEGTEIKLKIPSTNWSQSYKFIKSDLAKRDYYGLMFHIDDIPRNDSENTWKYILSINGNKEEIDVSYLYYDYPK